MPAALLDRRRHQRANTIDVERLERAHPEDAVLQVFGEEGRLDVVAGEAPRRLGEVVGSEGEEVGALRDLARGDTRPRQLDHGADQERQIDS